MNYNSMIVTFWFDEINDFKSIQTALDENMKDYFSPFNLTGIPSNFDPIVPRIISTTLGGHTTFNMSKVNVQLQTNFDKEFVSDFEKCYDYVKEKTLKVFDILTNKCSLKILYSAIVVNCEYETENPVSRIVSELFNANKWADRECCELGIKYSTILNEKYYSITCLNDAKVVSFTKKVEPGTVQNIVFPLIPQREVTIDKKVISFVEEINDKYSFDTVENYNTNIEVIKELFETCSSRINKLSQNINQGKLL